MKDQIPTIEVKLPVTGATVFLYSYLVTGEARQLQRLMMQEGKFDATTGQLSDLSAAAFMSVQDKALTFLVKEVKDKNGEVISFSSIEEWVGNLPMKDGNAIYDKINEITNASWLNEEAKKK